VVVRRPTRCYRVRRGRPSPCVRTRSPMDLDGEGRYRLAVDLVLDGRPLDEVAEELRVNRWLVAIWVENRELEESDPQDDDNGDDKWR
jgi:hypothetical protein